ncbi:MAG: hypothetical protein H8E31_03845 [Planctomycetes bacterium]|nr:hypothetical protein [Planctomycetota bacterium]
MSLLAIPLLAAAHGGHGDPALQSTAWHYLVEIAHLPLALLGLAAAAAISALWTRSSPRRRPRDRS